MRQIMESQTWHRALYGAGGIAVETASVAGTANTARATDKGLSSKIGIACRNILFPTRGANKIEMRVYGLASDNDTIDITIVGWPMVGSGPDRAVTQHGKGLILFKTTFTFGGSTFDANVNPITGLPDSGTFREIDTIAAYSIVNTTTEEWDAAGNDRSARLIFSPQALPMLFAFITAKSATTVTRVDVGLRTID